MVTTADHADAIAVAFQVTGNQFGERGVVFDQEDVGHGCFQKVLWCLIRPLREQARSHRGMHFKCGSGLAREDGLAGANVIKLRRIYALTRA